MKGIDRPDFYKSLNINNGDELGGIKLFDEIMALYNIVSDDYLSVEQTHDEGESSSYIVKMISPEKAHEIYKLIQYQHVTVYDHVFQIICWETPGECNLKIYLH